jgi:hypothetical protein
MTDRDLTEVLERAVDALSPRDPDPVGAVLRRVRAARRRRTIASGAVVVLAIASLGAVGALVLGGADGSTRTVPAGPVRPVEPVRQVEPWAGETVDLHGVHVPVPPGWQVQDAAPTPDGYPCRGTATARTVFVVRTGAGWRPCDRVDGSFVIVATVPQVYPTGPSGLPELDGDPSGQPVWAGDNGPVRRPSDRVQELRFAFSGVVVSAVGFDPDDAGTLLSEVSAEAAAPAGGVAVPTDARSAYVLDYGAAATTPPHSIQGWSRHIREDVTGLLSPAAALRCLPAPGTLTVAHLDRGSDAPDGSNGQPPAVLTFDRTGACDQAFDGRGGLVRVDGAALHQLLLSYAGNPPILGP